jgi:hypothetical protein
MILKNVKLIDEATYSCLSDGLQEINAGGIEDQLASEYRSHLKCEEPGIIGSLYREKSK